VLCFNALNIKAAGREGAASFQARQLEVRKGDRANHTEEFIGFIRLLQSSREGERSGRLAIVSFGGDTS